MLDYKVLNNVKQYKRTKFGMQRNYLYFKVSKTPRSEQYSPHNNAHLLHAQNKIVRKGAHPPPLFSQPFTWRHLDCERYFLEDMTCFMGATYASFFSIEGHYL